MKPQISDLLIKAKSLIDSPEKWTHTYYARDSKGKEVETSSYRACQFCSVGALLKAKIDLTMEGEAFSERAADLDAESMLVAASRECTESYANIIQLNDYFYKHVEGGHQRLMRVFDVAIKRAKEKECLQATS